MKKIYLLCLLSLFIIGSFNGASAASVEAIVTGTVTLLAKSRGFPEDFSSLYTGRDEAITLGKKGKTFSVTGTHNGAKTLTVTEAGEFTDATGRYSLTVAVPSIVNVFSAELAKDTVPGGTVTARFFNLLGEGGSGDDEDDNDDDEGSVSSIVTDVPVNISKTMSVDNIVATRKGNVGKLKGTFSKGKSAKGRFSLKFQF
jgi:hypothetical protein